VETSVDYVYAYQVIFKMGCAIAILAVAGVCSLIERR